MSTGPLGQGIATAVGVALGLRYIHASSRLSEAANERVPNVFVIASDGDMQEGVTAEASSFAGHNRLKNLVVFYDSNGISIDGPTSLSVSDNVKQRYLSYGWDVEEVPKQANGDIDTAHLIQTIIASQLSEKPTLIIVNTIIGWPSPTLQNTNIIHSNPLPAAEAIALKQLLHLGSDEFQESASRKRFIDKREPLRLPFDNPTNTTKGLTSDQNFLSKRRINVETDKISAELHEIDLHDSLSPRKANGTILNSLSRIFPNFIGGSADLTESNSLALATDSNNGNLLYQPQERDGRIHFGVREHAMAAIVNGLATHKNLIPYCATYLAFSDYQKPAIRMSAIMNLFVTHIWTHDSFHIGADGPTHQPIEQLAGLRAMPNFAVIRPANSQEVKFSWIEVLRRRSPTGMILARQDTLTARDEDRAAKGTAKGAYIVMDSYIANAPDIIIIATGSEVDLAIAAHDQCNGPSVGIRVVSMPCQEWFDEQTLKYRNLVLPETCAKRIIIEAGSSFGWSKYGSNTTHYICLDRFGESASGKDLSEKFGFTLLNVVSKINILCERP